MRAPTTHHTTWIVQVNQSILGPVVPQARPRGGKFRPARELPAALRQYLNLPDDINARPVIQGMTFAEIDGLALDAHLIRRTTRGHTRLLTIVLPPELRRPKPAAVPRNVPAIRSLRELCDYFGADTPAGLNRRIYKDTACGASLSLLLSDDTWLHNGDQRLRSLDVETPITGFTIQTIVEGSDATVDSDTFVLPVRQSEVKHWIADMEAEADRLWHEANDDDEGDTDR
jgi:hypothetical protein